MKDIKTSMMLYQGEQFEADDLENRRLFINDVIDSDVIDTIVYHILRYNREDKDIPVESRKPILLYVNTNGGSVPDGYALIDATTQAFISKQIGRMSDLANATIKPLVNVVNKKIDSLSNDELRKILDDYKLSSTASYLC